MIFTQVKEVIDDEMGHCGPTFYTLQEGSRYIRKKRQNDDFTFQKGLGM